jgi:hypothetical protein
VQLLIDVGEQDEGEEVFGILSRSSTWRAQGGSARLLSTRWLANGIESQHRQGRLHPIGSVCFGIKETNVHLRVLLGVKVFSGDSCWPSDSTVRLYLNFEEAQMNVRYRVELSQAERSELTSLMSGGEHAARKL